MSVIKRAGRGVVEPGFVARLGPETGFGLGPRIRTASRVSGRFSRGVFQLTSGASDELGREGRSEERGVGRPHAMRAAFGHFPFFGARGCALAVSICTAVLMFALAGPVLASPPELASPYGEVGRFGGFGSTPGKFVLPVGFAVDPGDSNAVYVLDRTVSEPAEGKLSYRLQKISSTGTHEVLGSTTFSETYTDKSFLTDAHPMISLAVDSSAHRVYALVEAIVEITNEEEYVPVAQRLVAWSTVPSGGKLVKAPGYAEEDPLTGAALVAGQSVLQSGKASEDLYAPEGLTVDPSNHDVIIEAQQGVKAHRRGGPTILQRVSTIGSSGKLNGSWVASGAEQADGVFTTTTGAFGIDLYKEFNKISPLFLVNPNFGTPEAKAIAEDHSGGADRDQAPTIDNRFTVNYNSNVGGNEGPISLGVYTAGSPVAQLSNKLYAARYAVNEEIEDPQAEVLPWNAHGPTVPFWGQGIEADKYVANEGVRLFDENGDVLTTIGGGSQACRIGTARISVAAGANGAVFVLTQPNEDNGDSEDQVIEFAEGAEGGVCPQPSGAPGVVSGGEELVAGKITAKQNVPLELDASAIDRAGEAPYEFDWNFEGLTSGGSLGGGFDLGSKIEALRSYRWPNPIAEHTYAQSGIYKASVRLIGDYGSIILPFEVKVSASTPPTARFTTPGSIVAGSAAAEFNGSASQASSSIIKYNWEFGDGGKAETSGPTVSHPYVTAGSYTVTLIITDEVGETATASHVVTVEPAVTVGKKPEETPKTGEGEAPKTETPKGPVEYPQGTGKPKALTNAQRLAKALAACKKKPKSERASCVKRAEKKYGPKRKSRRKKKKK